MAPGGATRVTVGVLGAVAALAGFEHGAGEALQGSVTPGDVTIQSWPDAAPFALLSGEPAMTLIPNLLVSGILTMVVSLALAAWCVWFAGRPYGWAGVFALSAVLLLVGGGFGPPLLGLIVGLAATRIGAPLTWWRTRLSARGRERLAAEWPLALGACLAAWLLLFPGLPLLGYVFGLGSGTTVVVVIAVAFALLLLAFLAAFARDASAHEAQTEHHFVLHRPSGHGLGRRRQGASARGTARPTTRCTMRPTSVAAPRHGSSRGGECGAGGVARRHQKEAVMQPDPTSILETLAIGEPLIGLYDAPDPAPFAPLVEPAARECVFASHARWREGKTLHITREKHGCGAPHLLGVHGRSREQMVEFLVGEEGLRASPELMGQWLDAVPGYQPRHAHVLIGPLRADQYEYLRSVTFYVDADQLAVLVTGASYYSRPEDPPVTAPFGSGCGQLAAAIGDLETPRAVIGATDQAMRKYLEPGLLAFTVTRPMFELLCRWADDPASSLHNSFLKQLMAARRRGAARRVS